MSFRPLLWLTLLLALPLQAADINAQLSQLFSDAKLNGTLVIEDVAAQKTFAHNPERAAKRYPPASTFKIQNSLIGLTTGAVSSVDEVFFHYDGSQLFLDSWEKDMGLREAIKVSNAQAYKVLARKIGLRAMQEHINRLKFGNQTIGYQVDNFWIDGPLMISANEEVALLTKLAKNELPYPAKVQADVRAITLLKSGKNWALHGKTGWTGSIGWFVGWLEQEGKIYSFALNIDLPSEQSKALLPKRVEIAEAGLKTLGLMQ